MVHSRNWNAAQEAIPADSAAASQGANRIRDLKVDIRERLDLDHIMDEDTTDDGRHRHVCFVEQGSDPGNLANKGFLYTKDVAGVTELFYEDDSGDVLQLTNNGLFPFFDTHNDWTAGQAVNEVNVTFATSLTIDAALSNAFRCVLTNNFTLNQFSNIKDGQVITVRFIQDATGGRTLAFAGATFQGNGADDLALSVPANDVDIMTFYRSNAVTYVLNLKKDIGNTL